MKDAVETGGGEYQNYRTENINFSVYRSFWYVIDSLRFWSRVVLN